MPRERVFILGINQSWREVHGDAHFANDGDQFDFDNETAAGYGGRPYYEDMEKRGRVYHAGGWHNHQIELDRHNALVFSRRPFLRRWRGPNIPKPELENDGGVAIHAGDNGDTPGSSCYAALQIAAASGFDRFWFVGLDMTAHKFDGAIGWAQRTKRTSTTSGAWSNSERHDALWRHVPEDVRGRVRVIAPSATKVFEVVEWPWPGPREGHA